MSMTSLPGDRPAATPFSPNSTSSTCGVSGTMVMTMSAACATASMAGDGLQALGDEIGLGGSPR